MLVPQLHRFAPSAPAHFMDAVPVGLEAHWSELVHAAPYGNFVDVDVMIKCAASCKRKRKKENTDIERL